MARLMRDQVVFFNHGMLASMSRAQAANVLTFALVTNETPLAGAMLAIVFQGLEEQKEYHGDAKHET